MSGNQSGKGSYVNKIDFVLAKEFDPRFKGIGVFRF